MRFRAHVRKRKLTRLALSETTGFLSDFCILKYFSTFLTIKITFVIERTISKMNERKC